MSTVKQLYKSLLKLLSKEPLREISGNLGNVVSLGAVLVVDNSQPAAPHDVMHDLFCGRCTSGKADRNQEAKATGSRSFRLLPMPYMYLAME